MKEDEWGCVVWGLILAGAGWWLWNNYEIRKKGHGDAPATLADAASPAPAIRPTGHIRLTELDSGTVWYLLADSVKGDRQHRVGWISEAHEKNKSIASRETKVLYQVDCDTTGYRELDRVEYDKGGKVLPPRYQADGKPNFAPPGSNISTVTDAVCAPVYDPEPVPTAAAILSPAPTG